jgi:hypothetical protein
MGENIPSWTKAALGTEMTPQQFIADKAAQDAVFNNRFGSYLAAGHSPTDAASIWFTGKPLAQAGNASDVLGTTAPAYARNFNKEFAAAGGQIGGQMASGAPTPPARPSDSSFAGPTAAPDSNSQAVVPGQGDPHQPGFDPSSVPFKNTPLSGETSPGAAAVPVPQPPGPSAPPGTQSGTYGGQPYTYATPGGPESAAGFGQQSMNEVPQSQQDMLAASLAQGQGQAAPSVDPTMLALGLQGQVAPPPPPAFDFGGDFGGFGGFGGGFGGLFG